MLRGDYEQADAADDHDRGDGAADDPPPRRFDLVIDRGHEIFGRSGDGNAEIDISSKTSTDPDYRLKVGDVADWEQRNGPIEPGTIVLLRTGWGSRYPDRKKYFGDDTPGATDKLHFPSYSEDSARYLVSNRHAAALGVDTASIDYGQSKDFIVHQIAMSASVPGLENVANLDRVPERGAWIIALPMKIGGGSGAPLRIVAVVPFQQPTRR